MSLAVFVAETDAITFLPFQNSIQFSKFFKLSFFLYRDKRYDMISNYCAMFVDVTGVVVRKMLHQNRLERCEIVSNIDNRLCKTGNGKADFPAFQKIFPNIFFVVLDFCN